VALINSIGWKVDQRITGTSNIKDNIFDNATTFLQKNAFIKGVLCYKEIFFSRALKGFLTT